MNPKGQMLFDGDCGICTWAASLARRIDRRKQAYQVVPYQRVPDEDLQSHRISRARCARKLHLITPKGKVRTGAFAINAFLGDHFPWSILAWLVYLVFPLLLIQVAAYAVVSRHRRRISGWLGFNECAVDPLPGNGSSGTGR